MSILFVEKKLWYEKGKELKKNATITYDRRVKHN
jgi:hypothetical protein